MTNSSNVYPSPLHPDGQIDAAHRAVHSTGPRGLEALVVGATSTAISTQLNIPAADVLARLRNLRRTFDTTNNLALAATVVRAGLV